MRCLSLLLLIGTTLGQTLYLPLSGSITSPFGPRSPSIGGSAFHWGVDIDGNTGDPIIAAYEGIVTFAGWHPTYGYVVVVTNAWVQFLYAHCSQLEVTVGEAVAAGQVIALVGTTGVSTGPHLHFEIRVDGEPVDPLMMLNYYAPLVATP
jgi:murein DD-endopeptidase MepM/ murein hydrolase activator NlpD